MITVHTKLSSFLHLLSASVAMADNQEDPYVEVDEEKRTKCWLQFTSSLTDLSHVPPWGQDRLPEEVVNALDAVMEDYRCNGPTVASQQVLHCTASTSAGPPAARFPRSQQQHTCPNHAHSNATAAVNANSSGYPRLLAWAVVGALSCLTNCWVQSGNSRTSVQAAGSSNIRLQVQR